MGTIKQVFYLLSNKRYHNFFNEVCSKFWAGGGGTEPLEGETLLGFNPLLTAIMLQVR